jgi:hypothetical protein
VKIKIVGLLALAMGFGAASSFAQSTTSTPKPKSEVRTITGCLSAGDGADEYLLTAKDGSTWEVKSTKVALSEHVGHTVSAHGVVAHSKLHNMKEDAKDAATDAGVKKNDSEHGHLTVTSLKMVGESCEK